MTNAIDRRSAFKIGLASAAALATPQIMTRAAMAQVSMPETENPGFNRFKLGEFEVTTILDGERPGDGPHPIFGADQSAEAVADLMEENLLPPDRFVNMFNPTLVNTGSELILFDTGIGEGGREAGLGQTRSRIEASGYSPDDISIVVVTHFHGDHIGGLMEDGEPAFANSRYVTGQEEYDFWTSPDRMSGPTEGNARNVEAKVKPLAEKTTFIGDGDEVVSGIVGMAAFGHTPGHMIYRLESGGKQLVLIADSCNHFVASMQRPDWHVSFDMDKEKAVETRKRVLDMLATDRLPFIGYHMPHPAVGFVQKMDQGFRFVPESYQLQL
ncbi:MAG: MBL fold metallo-hydrolase [Rhizobiaceae bacterium]|nr:MBL fold metallo-hydrolase [Rhizobiaceae bacterium]MCV0407932.1 MBL fold metallo-hydrolase [Rhizobiaceae bacterium]